VTSTSSLFDSGIEAVHRRSALRPLRRAGRACLNPAALFVILVVIGATFAGSLSGHGPNDQNLQARFAPPSSEYFLGTDALGRDTFTRILYGARISLATAISAALLSTFLGAILGLLAGYLGGIAAEQPPQRLSEVLAEKLPDAESRLVRYFSRGDR